MIMSSENSGFRTDCQNSKRRWTSNVFRHKQDPTPPTNISWLKETYCFGMHELFVVTCCCILMKGLFLPLYVCVYVVILGCGVLDKRPSRCEKFYFLPHSEGLHQGHKHTLAFSPHQHPSWTPHLQSTARPHCHSEGESCFLGSYTATF